MQPKEDSSRQLICFYLGEVGASFHIFLMFGLLFVQFFCFELYKFIATFEIYSANPSVANDDCLTPLEMARMKGHTNVVRAIEARLKLLKLNLMLSMSSSIVLKVLTVLSFFGDVWMQNHLCFFAGWLREVNLPGFLQAFAPQWASRKMYAK